MDPLKFAGVPAPQRMGDVIADAGELLLSRGKAATWRHVQGVAEACADLAQRFGLEEAPCRMAGILHDISAVIPPAQMLQYARETGMALDPAEEKYPFLLHQRLSAVVAQTCFGIEDESVLRAIACHTTLRAEASDLDMVLFLADKIAWDQSGEPPFLAALNAGLAVSLREGCRAYIDYVMNNGMILQPHQDLLAARAWLSAEIQECDE